MSYGSRVQRVATSSGLADGASERVCHDLGRSDRRSRMASEGAVVGGAEGAARQKLTAAELVILYHAGLGRRLGSEGQWLF